MHTVAVFSGGIGLGAYQAGAYEVLHQFPRLRPGWLLGSSVGAVNAALIAGNPPERRIEALREFWSAHQNAATPDGGPQGLSYLQNWMSAIEVRIFGANGYFRPRVRYPFESFASLYDLAPMRARIERLVDFERLNSGETRLSVATTEIDTGDTVTFDSRHGDRIGIDHLVASCGFLPEFAPVEIGGRLLGDGGLSANAPLEPVFAEPATDKRTVFVLDLFSRRGERPTDLAGALARKNDLMFGNQTWLRLQALQGAAAARTTVSREDDRTVAAAASDIVYLSYDPVPDEAGSEKPYDFSRRSIEARWQAGVRDMQAALQQLAKGIVRDEDLTVIGRA